MHTNEKPSEVLQAQTAAFIGESSNDFRGKAALFQHLGEIAALDKQTYSVTVTESGELQSSQANMEPPAEAVDTTYGATLKKQDYAEFLRSKDGSHSEAIQAETELLTAYHQFEPELTVLDTELSAHKRPEDHPSYLGSGAGARAFALQKNGHEYVALAFKRADPYAVNIKLRGALRGKGVPHLEQLVAASYEDHVTIAERIPGHSLESLPGETINSITKAQLNGLIDTLQSTVDKGIRLDYKPGNFLYDPSEGFGLIDYTSAEKPQHMADVLTATAMVLSQAGDWAYSGETTTSTWSKERIKQHNAQLYVSNLKVLEMFLNAVDGKFENGPARAAVHDIDRNIADYRRYTES